MKRNHPAFAAVELAVRYRPGGRRALENVAFTVPTGCFYAVLGPNGSGKSTLVRALLGLVRAETGEACVEGRAVTGWKRRELARRVGAVSQHEAAAFPISVRELVGMGRYPHLGPLEAPSASDHAAVEAALERCDARDLAQREVGTLSGGEFQRIRIARALAQEPAHLVLDEPTASLDIRHEMAILRLLRESADGGITIVLVTHQLDLAARFADRVLLLDDGRVAAEGSVEEVFRREILESVYRWPLVIAHHPVTGTPTVTPLGGRNRREG